MSFLRDRALEFDFAEALVSYAYRTPRPPVPTRLPWLPLLFYPLPSADGLESGLRDLGINGICDTNESYCRRKHRRPTPVSAEASALPWAARSR